EWRIDQAPVNPPSAVDRVYNGTIQYGIVHSDGQTRYHLYSGTMGATDAQLEAVSFGEEKPAASGASEDDHAQNRRVEIRYR
ncbi:MAG: hypothetical protein II058_06565, partial [Rhodocyclaceae bacterium]|nr:hypothetical protein [Rhodocyclaceae bacterium]